MTATPTKPDEDCIIHAARLLREAAEELKQCHTRSAEGHDWTGEPEAKAAYDESMAVAATLERLYASQRAMSTTPLPPLPVTEHNHPEHAWRWTPTEIRWMDARDAQWQAYAQQARADLEAENKRLREALQRIVDWDEAGMALTQDHIDGARAALKGNP